MTTNSHRQLFMIICVIIIVIVQVACNTSVEQTSNPLATEAPSVGTAIQLGQVDTPTHIPSAVPTETRTPIPIITRTPLPTLPDFDQVLTFGGGGAGTLCIPYTDPLYSFSGNPDNFLTGSLELCLVLPGTYYEKPFYFQLTGPDGSVYTSPNIIINQTTQAVEWDGYAGFFGGSAVFGDNGNLYVDLYLWWKPDFLEGQWRIQVFGESLDLTDDSMVTKQARLSYIVAVGASTSTEIVPTYAGDSYRPVKLKDGNKIEVIGSDFPANTEIYVLLYRTEGVSNAELVQKFSAISDSAGFVETEISAPFERGQTYLIVGLSDPKTSLTDCVNTYCDYFADDWFQILPAQTSSSSAISSCPGAPAQRMIVDQRGYVCTQSDAVRLRTTPSRSGDTVLQVVPGTQFTVIGGPSCSDNWSWWNVRLDNGTTGWLSEGGDTVDPYFICPLP